MEREPRTFSIGPYVEDGGIMGDRMEVDEKAASSIMRRTALRRDVKVVKGYGDEQHHTVGACELAIVISKAQQQDVFSETEDCEFSTLVKGPDDWVVQMHDQDIWRDVDDWMDKHFKADQEDPGKGKRMRDERFVGELRTQVTDGLRSAFWQEKMSILDYPFKKEKYALVCEALVVWTNVFIASSIIALASSSGDKNIDFIAGLAGINVLMSSFYSFIIYGAYISQSVDAGRINEKIGLVEAIAPNPQIPSILLGRASLFLNSGKLIRLKEE